MSKVSRQEEAIFNRAFDRAAKSEPGKPAELYPFEEKILRRWLERSRRVQERSPERIQKYLYFYPDAEFIRLVHPRHARLHERKWS